MRRFYFLFLCLFSTQIHALQLGDIPPQVVLEGKTGGNIDGNAWSSTMLRDKVYVLFYVDPDERDTNNAFSDALREKNFDLSRYGSVAIINMAATWLPNMVLESKLKAKQEKYPNAVYVKDKEKVLVQKWGVADESSDIVVFNKQGEVLYFKEGKLPDDEISKVLKLIEDNL